jgi:hypothetical protein
MPPVVAPAKLRQPLPPSQTQVEVVVVVASKLSPAKVCKSVAPEQQRYQHNVYYYRYVLLHFDEQKSAIKFTHGVSLSNVVVRSPYPNKY